MSLWAKQALGFAASQRNSIVIFSQPNLFTSLLPTGGRLFPFLNGAESHNTEALPHVLSCSIGKVLINGCEVPIIGRICMDQALVDVSGILDVKTVDVAVMIGQS